jgi:hypothetical protein
MLKKDARIALLNYREEFKKLLNNLKEDTRLKCKEYTKAQKELTKQQEEQKPKSFSFFSPKLKYKGGFLTKTMKKEINNQEKLFNSQLYKFVKQLYQKGGDSDYCASIIKEYQEKVAELKKNFEVLLNDYAEKNYREPLQHARSLYNQCALRYNEGEVSVPLPTKPSVPVHQASNKLESDSKKLFASMVAGPEYVNGKIQKPVIIAPNRPEETKKDDFASYIAQTKKYAEQQQEIIEATKGLHPQQQKGDKQNKEFEKATIGNTTYTKQQLENKSKQEREKLLAEFNKEFDQYKNKKDKDLNEEQKNNKKHATKIREILGKP